jgi:hypothetical protein
MTCRLVFEGGVSLRSVPRVMQSVVAWLRSERGLMLHGVVRHWSTGRWWLLRLGYAALTERKVVAADWVYLIDHTVQIGPQKCLLVLGFRLSEVRWEGRGLRHHDLQALAVVPMMHATGKAVEAELETATCRTGVPRAILSDRGSDVKTGVEGFCQAHPQTAMIYDIAHKAACLLKQRFERDPRWSTFVKHLGQTKFRLQQTELAYLVGPSLRPKARYMNLGPVLRWARLTLGILDRTPDTAPQRPRLEEKIGWLKDYREALEAWLGYYETAQTAIRFVRRQGLYLGAAQELGTTWRPQANSVQTASLAEELQTFVAEQSQRLRPGERLPGSTEVLESCQGKWKALERQQATQGFTGLLLALPAMLRDWSEPQIFNALRRVPTRVVRDWCRRHLGVSITAQRRLAYSPLGCKQISDECK